VPSWGAPAGAEPQSATPPSASGLSTRYKKGFAALAEKYGHDTTRHLHRLILEAVETVEAIVADCGIDCGFARTGQLTAALSPTRCGRGKMVQSEAILL
jgi:hypothetical protein